MNPKILEKFKSALKSYLESQQLSAVSAAEFKTGIEKMIQEAGVADLDAEGQLALFNLGQQFAEEADVQAKEYDFCRDQEWNEGADELTEYVVFAEEKDAHHQTQVYHFFNLLSQAYFSWEQMEALMQPQASTEKIFKIAKEAGLKREFEEKLERTAYPEFHKTLKLYQAYAASFNPQQEIVEKLNHLLTQAVSKLSIYAAHQQLLSQFEERILKQKEALSVVSSFEHKQLQDPTNVARIFQSFRKISMDVALEMKAFHQYSAMKVNEPACSLYQGRMDKVLKKMKLSMSAALDRCLKDASHSSVNQPMYDLLKAFDGKKHKGLQGGVVSFQAEDLARRGADIQKKEMAVSSTPKLGK